MIKATDIYAASNCGLDIILDYYPQARECVDNKKKFKRRPEEDDASACIKKYGDCYKVTDFGDQGTAMSPIDICMYEENLNFPEAIAVLASRFGVKDELDRTVNKPEIRKRPANADEEEGKRFFALEDKFTEEQLKVLGPRVRQEDVDNLHWHVVKCISFVKNREVIEKYTTPTYPIFIRECIIDENINDATKTTKFFKIYEPLNCDKQWRFSYTPDGAKPKQYVNGLYELKKAYKKYNDELEKDFRADPANEDKPFRFEKLPEAFICSGERDSLCVKAFGSHPLWFNSETYKVSPEEIKEIMKYVQVLYNIPDIDSTGITKGKELALRFLDIHTIWLPDWLSHYHDHRGKCKKDFRDFVELRPKNQDFRNLLALAMPAKFWVEKVNSKTGAKTYEIDSECLQYFLGLNGYYTLHDDNSDSVKFIHVTGHVVEQIKAKDITSFIYNWSKERFLHRDIRNLMRNSQRLSASSLEQIQEKTIDFTSYTSRSQFFFFKDQMWEITKDGIKTATSRNNTFGRYVWDTNVIDHKTSILPNMFNITVGENSLGEMTYDIDIMQHNSNVLRYLINTSRLYWRKELEEVWEDEDYDIAEKYRQEHKFDIAGDKLSESEIAEQKQNLVSKIFAIGYNLHRYKSPSRAWALYAMDNKIGDDGECNGRSGKSFLFNAFAFFMRSVRLSGRNPKLMDNPHVFDQVDQHSDFVLVDDCDKYLQTSLFYDSITGGMTVNPKNNKSFYIDFKDAPKFGFTTNYVPTEFDPSTNARLLYMVFSDYYHERTADNDYLETRSIRDDFNKNLFTDYTEDEWNNDINFFAQCLIFYLQMSARNIKIQPPMDNIIKRKYKSDMGANFEDWAYQYFSEEGEHLNTLIVREEALEDFKRFTGMQRCTMQKFTKALKAFAALAPYVYCLNPEEMLNSGGRLMRKKDDKTVEMIYLRTKSEQEKIQQGLKPEQPQASNGSGLPFTADNNDEPF